MSASSKNSLRISHSRAFTLIEVLMVVLLLGVIAGLAVPNFSGTFSSFQLSETAKNIASLMRYAQDHAIARDKKIRVHFDFLSGEYWLEEKIASADVTQEELDAADIFERVTGKYGRTFVIPKEVTAESENPMICFYPDAKIDKARIYLHNKHGNYFTVSTREQANDVQILDFKVE